MQATRLRAPRVRAAARPQGGFMMLEMALYLVVAMMILATVQLPATIAQIENSQAMAAGQYAMQVRAAVNRYVSGNLANIAKGTVPGFANPLAPTIAELTATQYLPAGFGVRTALGQTLLVQLTPQNCPGTDCRFPGIAYATTAVSDETGKPRIPLLATAAGAIGSDGLISMPATSARLTGPGGASAPNPVAGTPAGILAIRVGFGSTGYQDQVPSDLNGPCITITNAIGQISVRCNGNVTVTDGTNTSTMNAAGFSAPTGTVAARTLTTSGDNYLNATATQNTTCTTPGSIRTSTTGTGLVICNAATRIWQPIGTAVANVINGAPCSINGQLATDANNLGYLCKNSKYVLINNAVGNFVVNRQFTGVTDGWTTAKDSCPGGTPWAMYTPGRFIVNNTGYVNPPIEGNYYAALDHGSTWYAQASGISAGRWYSGNDTANLGGQLAGTMTTGCQY